ncbi:hypothetical protein GOBAR_AA31611 [Gossypium barbadense]|uniref:Reverse transcriptase zinc-binding domain-containing protein n=1 Tax=Gossypium barbadense TaxID=3634 RepID=A0A2P5WDB4_GOSBA|nr:hypothetical protein GOBAR_AA31611 [Gossypium barbadense]
MMNTNRKFWSLALVENIIVCGAAIESTLHVLHNCPVAKEVWITFLVTIQEKPSGCCVKLNVDGICQLSESASNVSRLVGVDGVLRNNDSTWLDSF